MEEREIIEKRLQELKTLRFLKKHDVNIQKVYSDINCDMLIAECYYRLDCYDTTFQRLTDSQYAVVQNMFS